MPSVLGPGQNLLTYQKIIFCGIDQVHGRARAHDGFMHHPAGKRRPQHAVACTDSRP
jgi:hypothetical protein